MRQLSLFSALTLPLQGSEQILLLAMGRALDSESGDISSILTVSLTHTQA